MNDLSFRCPRCGSNTCGGCDGREVLIVSLHRRIDRAENKGARVTPPKGRKGLTLEQGMRYLGELSDD